MDDGLTGSDGFLTGVSVGSAVSPEWAYLRYLKRLTLLVAMIVCSSEL